jgi:hypothetical protein
VCCAILGAVSNTVVTATLHDAEGPRHRRFALEALAIVLGLASFGLVFAGVSGPTISVAMAASIAMALFSRVLMPRARARRATLVCSKGSVRVTKAQTLNRTLRARDIVGATTARHEEHFVMSFGLKNREGRPLHLEVDTEDDVRTVCDALGIGHAGFGSVGFTLRARPRDLFEAIVRVVCGMLWLSFGAGMAFHDPYFGIAGVIGGVVLMNVVIVLWIMRRVPGPQIVLRSDGAHEGANRAWRPIPYTSLDGASVERDAITAPSLDFTLPAKPSAWLTDGMSLAERDILVSQLRGAAARTRGNRALKDEGPSTLQVIARNGEKMGDWLARLDAMAAAIGSGGGSYRSATFDTNDLWRLLEDPDADAEMRVAAVRMLGRLDPEGSKLRVPPVLDTVRDESVKRRIRVATKPDTGEVEEELLALEEEECLAPQRMSRPTRR